MNKSRQFSYFLTHGNIYLFIWFLFKIFYEEFKKNFSNINCLLLVLVKSLVPRSPDLDSQVFMNNTDSWALLMQLEYLQMSPKNDLMYVLSYSVPC